MTGADFIGEMMGVIRRQFFAGRNEKEWWQSESLVKKTITEPARWLAARGVALDAGTQRGILLEVLRTVATHGDLKAVKRMGAYLLHATQEHMRHNTERYYERAKAARNAGDLAAKIVKGMRRADDSAARDFTGELAAVRAALATGRKGRCKPGAEPGQLGLF